MIGLPNFDEEYCESFTLIDFGMRDRRTEYYPVSVFKLYMDLLSLVI